MARRRRNRKWLWGVVVFVVVLVTIVGIVIWKNNQNDHNDNSDNGEKESVIVEEGEKEEKNEERDTTGEVIDEKKVVQYDGKDPNEANELSGVVTYAGVNDGVLVIRVNIDQYVTSGSCELSLVQGGVVVYSNTVNVVPDVATATCEGFDVLIGGLGNGNTKIDIKLNADGKDGVISGEVEV